jgi:hypothetical protein
MLNYNLNINSPLQQAKKNEDVRPPINWDFHSFASASDSTDLSERTFATMSIDAPGTNCIQVSVDSGNSFTTDGQYPVTASVTGSNWPITGSTTMSLFTFGITYDPTSTNQFYIDAVSASAAEINVNPSITGSIVTNEFSASEFYRWYVSGSVVHMKGNVYNGPINWLARNQSPSTTTGPVNGFTSSFNIVKDRNVRLVNLQEVTGSTSSSFNNVYALNITSSLTASIINDATGSTTMSINIPEAGITTSSILFNSSSAGIEIITASFTSSQNQPYNITASVIFNKGNIWNAKVNWLTTGSNADSYSLYTIPTQFNIFKDVNVDGTVINQNVLMAHSELTQSVSGEFQTQYAFNFETEVTQSITYPSYQVYAYPTTSLVITPDVGNTTVYNSGSTLQFTEQPDGPSYQITASAYINKIPSLFATVVVIGAGGSGSVNGSDGSEVKGAGGGAGGFYQTDIIVAPNLPYVIETIAKNPTDADYTKFTYYNGIGQPYGSSSILAFSGNSALDGGGGRSGYVNIYLENDAYNVQGLNNGNINGGGGGGGTYNSASGANGGLDLGGAGSLGTASLFPTLFFQSSSFQLTGSAGDGSTLSIVNGGSSTAFGGGGGGALATGPYAGTAGSGGQGAVIVAYSGSQKLTVPAGTITRFENGLTVHIFKQTGSFSYDYVPIPNPAKQPYQWRTETLAIAGGGAGGTDEGGGGGAGGYSYNPNFYYELGKTYNVTVGAGLAGKTSPNAPTTQLSGSDSYITDNVGNTILFSKGGGAGFASPGGSGGGATNTGAGGTAAFGYYDNSYYIPMGQKQGNDGGGADPTFDAAGGGGGASSTGSLGSNPGGGGPTPNSGAGGIGAYTIDFIPIRVCGGGTGVEPGANALNLGAAWGGGVPTATTGSNATSFGSGGGGGRGVGVLSGAGANGLVQIRYAGTQRATGGQIQTALLSGSYYTLHTFTASGIFEPTN